MSLIVQMGFRWERRVQNQCRHLLLVVIVLLEAAVGVVKPALAQTMSLSFKGFNYVSYYNGGYTNADSLPALVGTGANSVALAFEYGIDVQHSAVYADAAYTDSLVTLAATIAEANSRGLSVMVRPLIDFLDPTKIGSYKVGDWRSFYNPTDPAAFFASYKTMIVNVAQVAQANSAAILCIGVELDQLTGPNYLSYWTDIIASVRKVFSGKLTYSADWDDNISPWQGQHGLTAGTGNLATQVSFWSQLDYLGIDVYAPISDAASPSLADLVAGWTLVPSDPTSKAVTGNQSLISYFQSVATQTGKPLLFTELGYESASDAAQQPWGTSTNIYDPALQANLYTAFFTAWQQSGNNSLTGVYFWNWDPNAAEVGPGNGPNFSPQGQPAQAVVTAYFGSITTGGTLAVSPNSTLNLTGPVGGPFTSNYSQFMLTNTGSGSLKYSISPPSWLTVSPSSSGSLAGGASASVTVSAGSSANTMGAGNYSSTIIFTNTTNGSGNTSVATNLVVFSPAAGVLAVTPNATLNLTGPVGGPFTSNYSQYTLTNTGTASLNYSISPPSWLSLSPASGSLAAGASVSVTVSAGSSANTLGVGSYSATITFTNTTNGSGNTSVATNLVAYGTGALTVTPNVPLNFNGSVGGPFASDMSGQFTLTNIGLAALSYSISPPYWLDVSPSSSGTLAVGASALVVVFAGPAALGASAGNYPSTITFTNTTNGKGNTSVVTNLLVTQQPGGNLDPYDNGRSDPPPDAVAGVNRPPQLPQGQ